MTKEKPYNNGKWTQARFNSFITSVLRMGMRKWEPVYHALDLACVGRRLNKATGRQVKKYECAGCAKVFLRQEVQVDHIEPVVDVSEGFAGWDSYIARLFCEVDNLQVLCKECHSIKTANERKQRYGKED